jgi:cation transport ATPase
VIPWNAKYNTPQIPTIYSVNPRVLCVKDFNAARRDSNALCNNEEVHQTTLQTSNSQSAKSNSIRLIASDSDGTLLNSQFQISPDDLAALRDANASGIEVVLVTGRRHTFALPIAQQLGFDHWVISSNGAVTRSLAT